MHEAANHAGPASTARRTYSCVPPVLGAWIIVCLLAMTYGSLLPFDFERAPTSKNAFGLLELRWAPATADDVWTNILVYVPIGALLALAVRVRFGRFAAVVLAPCAGLVLSTGLESVQTCLRSRVGSWTDVVLNTLGTLAGALATVLLAGMVRGAILQVRHEMAVRPYRLAASLLTLALLLHGLAPFDFVSSTEELHASFSRANWGFRAMTGRVTGESLAAGGTAASGGLWFALLGYLLMNTGLEAKRRRLIVLGSAVKNGFLLAALIEGMQLFTRSHVFDSQTLFLRLIAIVLGAWSALFLAEQLNGDHSDSAAHPPAVPASIWLFLALLQAVLVVMPLAGGPGDGWLGLPSAVAAPLEHLWRLPGPQAVSGAVSLLATYGVLGFTASAAIRRAAISRQPAWLASLLTATVAGAVVSLSAGRAIDPSPLVLAIPAAVIACRLERVLATTLLDAAPRPLSR